MKIYYLIPLLLLAGCAREIVIEDYKLTEEYDQSTGNFTHGLYFTLYNPAYFKTADCSAVFELDTESEVISKKYLLGEVEARSRVRKAVVFVMPDGETRFNLSPVCSFR